MTGRYVADPAHPADPMDPTHWTDATDAFDHPPEHDDAAEPSLCRWLSESDFPADTDTVLALLVRRGTPAGVLRRLAGLPWSVTFADLDECQRSVRHEWTPPRTRPSQQQGKA